MLNSKENVPQCAKLQVSILLCNLCYALISSATGRTQYKEIRPASCTWGQQFLSSLLSNSPKLDKAIQSYFVSNFILPVMGEILL